MCAGAISLLYRVTATEAKATAMPRNILPRYSMGSVKAAHVMMTPMSNRIPAINIVVFLPYLLHSNISCRMSICSTTDNVRQGYLLIQLLLFCYSAGLAFLLIQMQPWLQEQWMVLHEVSWDA